MVLRGVWLVFRGVECERVRRIGGKRRDFFKGFGVGDGLRKVCVYGGWKE